MPIAKVILPIALDKDFDYSLPEGISPSKGCRVLVDFNNKKTVAIVVDVVSQSRFSRLKPVISCLDTRPVLTASHFEFSRLLTKAYPYPLSDFLFMMLPKYLRKPRNLDFAEKPHDKPSDFCARFIKSGSFQERYSLWKEDVKAKLAQGSVVICFPQMSYLEQAYESIKNDFPNAVAINSYLTEKENFKAWQASRQRTLILGTRMALFYFPQDTELIVVEDESSPYYFQEEKPFYSLVEAAFILARHKGIPLILSGDYPSLDTYRLINEKQIGLIEEKEKPADVRVVDVLSYRNKGLVSPLLAELLRKNIEENKKSLILWNKKGTASFVSCESCGWALACPACLSFMHLDQLGRSFCPHCGLKKDFPQKCPSCNNGYLKGRGAGVEKIEAALKKYFPSAKISQWDKSGVSAQIIVSTPRILSGIYGNETFDNAYLLDIDNVISRLDYGAAFEAFLYVKKVAGLVKNSFYIFTRNPGFYLFECLNKDWREFYNRELEVRQKLNLPPFGLLAAVTLRGKNEEKLLAKAMSLAKALESAGQESFGPFKEYPFKLSGKFRYSIVVKYKYTDRRVFQDLIKKEIDKLRSSSLQAAIVIK